LDEVLSVHAFDFDRFSTKFTSHTLQKAEKGAEHHKHDQHSHSHKDKDHHHHEKAESHNHNHHRGNDNDVHTISFSVDKQVSFNSVQEWLADLLWERQLSVFRIKGSKIDFILLDIVLTSVLGQVCIKDDPHRWMIHGVQTNFDVKPTNFTWDDTLPGEEKLNGLFNKRINKFVFIGKNIDKEFLRQSFVDLK